MSNNYLGHFDHAWYVLAALAVHQGYDDGTFAFSM